MTNILATLVDGQDLDQQTIKTFFEEVLKGETDPIVLASVLTALKMKGETPEEISGAALAIKNAATGFPLQAHNVADCVGTGGDGANTINISTTAAILAATCGLKVAKHGNRSVSSMSGSADLLEAFGVNLNMSPETASNCLDKANLCFLYAPAYHTGFKHAASVRKTMGVRTLFNILGPLANPANPKVMLLGVYTPDLLLPMAEALQLTGVERAFVVYGSGLDEIALHGETNVIELNAGKLTERTISPQDFGLKNYSLEQIKGGTPQENADIIKTILSGKGQEAHNAAVIINCAALLYLHAKADTLKGAAQLAGDILKSGKGLATLEQLVVLSNEECK
ncbi:anthranilate phosphoribosyltransferase [Colwellia sp. 4_MG-2023]|jgi:anthranilate phosphoribosyltransferase|uniref:anthranilate phosphoribosyltransferase n=1 Tax=unclassified Colwellia TaxID=196834 RepID=UPI001C09A9C4|nr:MULTISPECIES: anthranilate phosphoribosyltransferase [unclassified Colwellia]MBU2923991.1 anthranilate phosphoribosyltransferase [Colwellia sp. C2M11]MDO6507907.1 anthranilate phosphoribosyltransferase [Colwellia sp. 5_MG-2023]MDO6556540.1 anthranilate phosphoribosyltransferase [Colwellia sp. 4_MG-2023]MDO6653640.1 anthranilate phosphoribosyltransferase [Colwellia sp. 3_MG-2023]MDO6666573.1 anthranilate phosphoribosyltransferase [Colwellia sp. 2_MG-2023]